jgi:GT2 family glycosyltransferase
MLVSTVNAPHVAIVMPTFNRKDEVIRCVRCAIEAVQQSDDASLVIVDNGSSDGTWEWLLANVGDRAVLIALPGVSISELRNAGATATSAEILCFVDSDCIVEPDHVARVKRAFVQVEADMVGAMYGLPENAHWIEATWMRLNCPDREGYTRLLPGGSMAVKRDSFDRVGGFNPAFVTGEDADLCERVLATGGKIWETPALKVVHLRNMRSLRGFFAKQVWHALGDRAQRAGAVDRPSMMGCVHCALSILALILLVLPAPSIVTRALLGGALILAVPFAAVSYRVLFRSGAFIPVKSLLLYSVYFYARGWAMAKRWL